MSSRGVLEQVLPVQPRRAAKNWRVMGMWKTGVEFLISLASDEEDCRERLAEALTDFTQAELQTLDSVWIEQWTMDEPREAEAWLPTEEVSLRRERLRIAAKQQHAKRKTA